MNKDNARDPIASAVQHDPAVAKAVSGLSEKDMAKLREVLADPEKTKQILSTPMAQQFLRRLSGSGNDKS